MTAMRTGQRILIVEDHKPLRSLLSFLLGNAGYDIAECADALSAGDEISREAPDLVLLDRQLPDMDGLDLLRRWRTDDATARVPVIVVSGKATEGDRVTGLKAGADDYIAKPFGRDELLARVEAVLRRSHAQPGNGGDLREFEGLRIDTRSLRIMAGSQPLHLGPIEFKMLNLFVANPERVLSRQQIVDRVWRANAYVDERTVDVHVRRLRRALEPAGYADYVQTVRGVGYRLSRSTRSRGSDAGEARGDGAAA